MNVMMALVDPGLITFFVQKIFTLRSQMVGLGSILSDHVPLSFLLHLDCVSVPFERPIYD